MTHTSDIYPCSGFPWVNSWCLHCRSANYVLPDNTQFTDSFTAAPYTVLTAGIYLSLGLYQWCLGVNGIWKTVEIPTGHVSPQSNGSRGNRNLYLDHPITQGWCQPIGGHVSYSTDSPITTRLELCGSLSYSASKMLQHKPFLWFVTVMQQTDFIVCELIN